MPEIRVPVGTHFFTPEALQKSLDAAIKQSDLGPNNHGGAVAAVDAEGVKVAVLFTSKDDHWRVRGAYTHDWGGNNTVAGDLLYRF